MKKLVILIILSILIPYIVIINDKEEIVKFNKIDNFIVKVKDNNEIKQVLFEDYIVGVVAAEMPAEFEMDALKAQAVASRSYVLDKIEKNKNNSYDIDSSIMNQVYIDNNKMRDKWNDKYDLFYQKIKKCVDETKGEYLTYNGKVIEAFFFSTSSGKTENSEDVFQTSLPYLRSVESSWDKASPVFSGINTYSLSEFYTNLGLKYNRNPNIKILERSETGHIKSIKVDDTIFKGTDFRFKLKLKSTYFDIKNENDNIVISTQGYGHGVGMSQYGANYMAKEGYNYQDILKHYYKDVKISKLNV